MSTTTKLSPEITQLIREAFAVFDDIPLNQGAEKLAIEDPEACVIALLKAIKEDLHVSAVCLDTTVGHAVGEVHEAKWQATRSRSKSKR